MTQRVFVLGAVALLFLASTTFGQEKKESPASPSDIPVDQIKKEAAKQKPGAQTKEAQTKEAQPSSTKATEAQKVVKPQDEAPKPVVEGTSVAQPDCGIGNCNSCCDPCDPCRKRCRGKFMGRLRSLFSRKCSTGC